MTSACRSGRPLPSRLHGIDSRHDRSLFGTPRTATVSFTVGSPVPAKSCSGLGTAPLLGAFFLAAFLFSYKENQILANVGKVLNPCLLALLFLVFVVAFANPLGNPTSAPVTSAYVHNAVTNGFLEGYNTMDALAGLAFGVTVVTAVRSMGQRRGQGCFQGSR